MDLTDTETAFVYEHRLDLQRFYRYTDSHWGSPHLDEYVLVKETPCGFWLTDLSFPIEKRWVSKTGTKRFAYPTEREALESYLKRKQRQVKLLTESLSYAKTNLALAIEMCTKVGIDTTVRTPDYRYSDW